MTRSTGLVLAAAVAAFACGSDTPTTPSGVTELQVVDLRVGTGAEAVSGSVASVSYAGWLYETGAQDNKGSQFDAGTFAFVVGAGQVIQGWDQGVPGMREGGLRATQGFVMPTMQ